MCITGIVLTPKLQLEAVLFGSQNVLLNKMLFFTIKMFQAVKQGKLGEKQDSGNFILVANSAPECDVGFNNV